MRSSSLVLSRGLHVTAYLWPRTRPRAKPLANRWRAGGQSDRRGVPILLGSSHPCTAMGLSLSPCSPPAVASTLGCGAFSSRGYAATLGHGGAHLLLLTASPPSPFSSVSPPRATLGTPLIDRSRPGILRRGWHAGHKSAEALAMWRSTAGWLLFTKTSVVGLARSPLPPPHLSPPHAVRSAQRQSDRSRPGIFASGRACGAQIRIGSSACRRECVRTAMAEEEKISEKAGRL